MAKTDIIECTAQHDNETGEIIVSSSLSGPAPQTGEEKKPAPEAAKPSVKDQGSSKIMPEGPKLSVCPNCGAYLTKSDYHFCPKCGADLSAPLNPGCCTKCGARLPYRLSTYCPTCGKKLREEEAAVSGPSKSSGKDSDGTSPEEKIRMKGRSIIGQSIFGLILGLIGLGQYFIPSTLDLSLLWILSGALAIEAIVILVLTAIKIKDRRLLLGLAFFFSCTYFITAGGILFLSVYLNLAAFVDLLTYINAPIDFFARVSELWRIEIAVVFGFIASIVGLILFIKSLVIWVKFSRKYKKTKVDSEPEKSDDSAI